MVNSVGALIYFILSPMPSCVIEGHGQGKAVPTGVKYLFIQYTTPSPPKNSKFSLSDIIHISHMHSVFQGIETLKLCPTTKFRVLSVESLCDVHSFNNV